MHTLGDLTVCHVQEEVHQEDVPSILGQRVQRLGQPVILNQDHISPDREGSVFPGIPVIGRKLLHRILRQLAESDFARLPTADLPITVVGLALQYFLAEAVKGVLLVFVVAVRCHCLTSLLAGRQVITSPFAHYSSAGGTFWLVPLEKFQKNFFTAHGMYSFRFVRVDRTGSKRKGRGAAPGQQKSTRTA